MNCTVAQVVQSSQGLPTSEHAKHKREYLALMARPVKQRTTFLTKFCSCLRKTLIQMGSLLVSKKECLSLEGMRRYESHDTYSLLSIVGSVI